MRSSPPPIEVTTVDDRCRRQATPALVPSGKGTRGRGGPLLFHVADIGEFALIEIEIRLGAQPVTHPAAAHGAAVQGLFVGPPHTRQQQIESGQAFGAAARRRKSKRAARAKVAPLTSNATATAGHHLSKPGMCCFCRAAASMRASRGCESSGGAPRRRCPEPRPRLRCRGCPGAKPSVPRFGSPRFSMQCRHDLVYRPPAMRALRETSTETRQRRTGCFTPALVDGGASYKTTWSRGDY
jgi:hypothetical protein